MNKGSPKDIIFREFLKRGHSNQKGKRVWDISNPELLFLTSELAKGFLNLRTFGLYKKNVFDREMSLIRANASALTIDLGRGGINLIDMRCADGAAAVAFLESLHGQPNVRYCPTGMSKLLLGKALGTMKEAHFKNVISYKPQIASFENLGQMCALLRNKDFQKNVVLLLGSFLANFEINDFLFQTSKDMFKGDYLVIGNGIRTGERLSSLQTYQNGVFQQWFIHLMKEIGFKESEVSYNARFGNSRVECFYTLKVDKTLKHGDKIIELKKGDEVVVGVVYKYYEKELEKFCRMYFSKVEIFTDEDNEYALLLCRK